MSFAELSQNFIESLLRENAELHTDKFLVHDYRNERQGRGLIALKDIEEGEDLFSIPRSLLLNIQTCSLSEDQKEQLNKLGQWEALILVILYERSLGDKSKWFDYFQILPFNEKFNNLMFWQDSELENLKPSFVLDRIGKEGAVEMYNKLFPDVIVPLGVYDQLKDVTVDQFHRVASTIMSYSFDVENPDIEESEDEELELVDDKEEDEDEDTIDVSKEGYYKSMVPLADTLNADTNLCNANLTYTPASLVMKLTCPIKKGDQIYNTYANHPNSEILRRYGYVEFGGSKHDFGELKLDSILEYFTLKYEFPQKLIDKIIAIIGESEYLLQLTEGQNIIIETYDCYIDGDVYAELILLFQILTVLGVLNLQDKKMLKKMTKTDLEKFLNRNFKKNYQLVEQKKLMRSTYENFTAIIDKRISEYPLINKLDIVEDYDNRDAMAQCVLLSELTSLQNSKLKLLAAFELIDDDKMIKNVMKRKLEEDAEKAQRKKKHRS